MNALSALPTAEVLHRAGIYSVPACWPNAQGGCACPRQHAKEHEIGKAPLIAAYQDIVPSLKDYHRWWAEWPEANVAILLQQSGVVDVAPDSLVWRHTFGERGLPLTLAWASGGGAGHEHHLYRLPGGWPARRVCRTGEYDILGAGIAICPPSRHRLGQPYAWQNLRSGLALAPAWVLAMLQSAGQVNGVVELPADLPPVNLAGWRLRKYLQELIVLGPAADPERWGDRSRPLWHVELALMEAGMDDAQVASVILDPQYAISEKPREQGRQWLAREIGKARHYKESPPQIGSSNGTGHTPPGPPPPGTHTVGGTGDPPLEETLTDSGNAARLVLAYGQDLHYDETSRRWLVWRRGAWNPQPPDHPLLVRWAQARARALRKQAIQSSSKALQKFAERSLNRAAVDNAVKLAQAVEGVGVSTDQLDQHPFLLNVRNGTLDLRTGSLRAAERGDLLTRRLAFNYDPDATCARWQQFLDEVLGGDQETIRFIQRAIGYSLTGDTSERVMFILMGEGMNGKSVFLSTLHNLLGPFAVVTPTETLLLRPGASNSIPNDVARLKGARLVTAIESDIDQRLNEAKIKGLTGGSDKLTGRFLHGEFFDFRPELKLWLATNHLPSIRGRDKAIWDRLRIVPFEQRFEGDQQRRTLAQELGAELTGILRWAVEGCRVWQRDGLGTSEAVESATRAHATDMDQVGRFIDEECTVGARYAVLSADLYEAYTQWCSQGGEPAWSRLTSNAFGRQLSARGYEIDREPGGARRRRGLALRAHGPNEPPLGGWQSIGGVGWRRN